MYLKRCLLNPPILISFACWSFCRISTVGQASLDECASQTVLSGALSLDDEMGITGQLHEYTNFASDHEVQDPEKNCMADIAMSSSVHAAPSRCLSNELLTCLVGAQGSTFESVSRLESHARDFLNSSLLKNTGGRTDGAPFEIPQDRAKQARDAKDTLWRHEKPGMRFDTKFHEMAESSVVRLLCSCDHCQSAEEDPAMTSHKNKIGKIKEIEILDSEGFERRIFPTEDNPDSSRTLFPGRSESKKPHNTFLNRMTRAGFKWETSPIPGKLPQRFVWNLDVANGERSRKQADAQKKSSVPPTNFNRPLSHASVQVKRCAVDLIDDSARLKKPRSIEGCGAQPGSDAMDVPGGAQAALASPQPSASAPQSLRISAAEVSADAAEEVTASAAEEVSASTTVGAPDLAPRLQEAAVWSPGPQLDEPPACWTDAWSLLLPDPLDALPARVAPLLPLGEYLGAFAGGDLELRIREVALMKVDFHLQVLWSQKLYGLKTQSGVDRWRLVEEDAVSKDLRLEGGRRSRLTRYGDWTVETFEEVMAGGGGRGPPLGFVQYRLISRGGITRLAVVDYLYRNRRQASGAGQVGERLLRRVRAACGEECKVLLCTVRPATGKWFAQTPEDADKAAAFYERQGFLRGEEVKSSGLFKCLRAAVEAADSKPLRGGRGRVLGLAGLVKASKLQNSLPVRQDDTEGPRKVDWWMSKLGELDEEWWNAKIKKADGAGRLKVGYDNGDDSEVSFVFGSIAGPVLHSRAVLGEVVSVQGSVPLSHARVEGRRAALAVVHPCFGTRQLLER